MSKLARAQKGPERPVVASRALIDLAADTAGRISRAEVAWTMLLCPTERRYRCEAVLLMG